MEQVNRELMGFVLSSSIMICVGVIVVMNNTLLDKKKVASIYEVLNAIRGIMFILLGIIILILGGLLKIFEVL